MGLVFAFPLTGVWPWASHESLSSVSKQRISYSPGSSAEQGASKPIDDICGCSL